MSPNQRALAFMCLILGVANSMRKRAGTTLLENLPSRLNESQSSSSDGGQGGKGCSGGDLDTYRENTLVPARDQCLKDAFGRTKAQECWCNYYDKLTARYEQQVKDCGGEWVAALNNLEQQKPSYCTSGGQQPGSGGKDCSGNALVTYRENTLVPEKEKCLANVRGFWRRYKAQKCWCTFFDKLIAGHEQQAKDCGGEWDAVLNNLKQQKPSYCTSG